MKIAVIDYKAGNVQSVLFALQRLGIEAELTADPNTIEQADKVIFPGVGEAGTTMKNLRERQLDTLIPTLQQPVLGICVGMQLLCEHSEEGNTDCLGIIPQRVLKFQAESGKKVPHMGWNSLDTVDGRLLDTAMQEAFVYFVHSYYVEVGPYTIGQSTYTVPFSCALRKDNFWATQFHPEKSGSIGEKVLKNFLFEIN